MQFQLLSPKKVSFSIKNTSWPVHHRMIMTHGERKEAEVTWIHKINNNDMKKSVVFEVQMHVWSSKCMKWLRISRKPMHTVHWENTQRRRWESFCKYWVQLDICRIGWRCWIGKNETTALQKKNPWLLNEKMLFINLQCHRGSWIPSLALSCLTFLVI